MSQAGPVAEVSGVGAVLFLEGDTGGEIGPNGAGVINIVGAGTITVMGDAATNTLTITDTNVAWTSVSTSQTMVDNMGYFVVAPGGAVVLTLPPTSIQGDVVEIALDGAASWQIAQGAGQSILYGDVMTTTGVGGSLMSTQQGDGLRLVCRIPNLRWVMVSSVGNAIVV